MNSADWPLYPNGVSDIHQSSSSFRIVPLALNDQNSIHEPASDLSNNQLLFNRAEPQLEEPSQSSEICAEYSQEMSGVGYRRDLRISQPVAFKAPSPPFRSVLDFSQDLDTQRNFFHLVTFHDLVFPRIMHRILENQLISDGARIQE